MNADGAVAQLGERIPRTDEVRGSNPLGSTINYRGGGACGESSDSPLRSVEVAHRPPKSTSKTRPINPSFPAFDSRP